MAGYTLLPSHLEKLRGWMLEKISFGTSVLGHIVRAVGVSVAAGEEKGFSEQKELHKNSANRIIALKLGNLVGDFL